jgi:hypothetical protein
MDGINSGQPETGVNKALWTNAKDKFSEYYDDKIDVRGIFIIPTGIAVLLNYVDESRREFILEYCASYLSPNRKTVTIFKKYLNADPQRILWPSFIVFDTTKSELIPYVSDADLEIDVYDGGVLIETLPSFQKIYEEIKDGSIQEAANYVIRWLKFMTAASIRRR